MIRQKRTHVYVDEVKFKMSTPTEYISSYIHKSIKMDISPILQVQPLKLAQNNIFGL